MIFLNVHENTYKIHKRHTCKRIIQKNKLIIYVLIEKFTGSFLSPLVYLKIRPSDKYGANVSLK